MGLAGPAVPRADAPVFAQSDAVVIAIDMSPSVAEGPALEDAQAAAAGLLGALAGRPVGLILYAGEAYSVAAPPPIPRRSKARSRSSRPRRCPMKARGLPRRWRWRGRCLRGSNGPISC
ncbi:hypothetical protein QWZ10_14650 [Paracoccus cavernae]|uniref:VWA domain-containing protein n=1 Tax=Paracoccus cavernae TaxID=1571207 RepID=A0ABT8D9V1_9RHOB|nr:hypothetical protein [Paracoccus cavernae]